MAFAYTPSCMPQGNPFRTSKYAPMISCVIAEWSSVAMTASMVEACRPPSDGPGHHVHNAPSA